jgi:hypothetical protein
MNHRTKRLSFHSITLIILFAGLYAIPSQFGALLSDLKSGSDSRYYLGRLVLSMIILLVTFLFFLSACKILWIKLKYHRKSTSSINSETGKKIVLEISAQYCSLCSLFACLYFNLTFLRRGLSYSCYTTDSLYMLIKGRKFCYDEESLDVAFALESTIVFVAVIVSFVSISNVSIKLVWCTYIIGIITVVFVGAYWGNLNRVMFKMIYVLIFVATVIADLQYSGILDYCYSREVIELHHKLNSVKAQSESMFKENMRVLVGNVAHDIKSVSHLFL